MELTRDDVKAIASRRMAKQNNKKFIAASIAGLAIAIVIILPKKESLPLYIEWPGYVFLVTTYLWYYYHLIFQSPKQLESKLLEEWKQYIV